MNQGPAEQLETGENRLLLVTRRSPAHLSPGKRFRGSVGLELRTLILVFLDYLRQAGVAQELLEAVFLQLHQLEGISSTLSWDGSRLNNKFEQALRDLPSLVPHGFLGYLSGMLESSRLNQVAQLCEREKAFQKKRGKAFMPELPIFTSRVRHLYKTQKLPNEADDFRWLNESSTQDWFYMWQAGNFRLLKSIYGHGTSRSREEGDQFCQIHQVCFDAKGKLIFSSDDVGLIKVWSADSCLLLNSFVAHNFRIRFLEVTPCNRYLISLCQTYLKVWSLKTLACVYCDITSEDRPFKEFLIDESGSESLLIVADREGRVQVIRVSEFVRLETFSGGHQLKALRTLQLSEGVSSITINKQGLLMCTLYSGLIEVFNLHNDCEKIEGNLLINQRFNVVVWSYSCDRFAAISQDQTISIYRFTDACDLHQEQVVKFSLKHRFRQEHYYALVCWSLDSAYILIAHCQEGRKPEDNNSRLLAFSCCDKRLHFELTEDSNPFLRLNCLIQIMENHPKSNSLCFYGDSVGQVVLLDIARGFVLNVFWITATHIAYPNLQMCVMNGGFSPDGTKLVIASDYGSFQVYGCAPKDFYSFCPTEQFFQIQKEEYEFRRGQPFSVRHQLPVNALIRGPICNANLDPYIFRYKNNFEELSRIGYFQTQKLEQPQDVEGGGQEQSQYQRCIQKEIKQNHKSAALLIPHYQQLADRLATFRTHQNLEISKRVVNSSASKIIQIVQVCLNPPKQIIIQNFGGKKERVNLRSRSRAQLFQQKIERPDKNVEQPSDEEPRVLRRRDRRVEEDEKRQQFALPLLRTRSKAHLETRREESDQDIQPQIRKRRKVVLEQQEDSRCSRCKVNQLNYSCCCPNCYLYYCTGCSVYRLVMDRCLACAQIQNCTDFPKKIDRTLINSDDRDNQLPQVGQWVMYIPQAHQEHLMTMLRLIGQKEGFSNFNIWEVEQSKQSFYPFLKLGMEAVRCQVIKADYTFPKTKDESEPIVYFLLKTEAGTKFVVVAKVSGLSQILVPAHIYNYLLVNLDQLQKMQTVHLSFRKNDRECQLLGVQPKQSVFPNSLYKACRVRDSTTDRHKRRSEQFLVSPWLITFICKAKSNILPQRINYLRCQQLLQEAIASAGSLSTEFINPVSVTHYPTYLDFVVYPMSLSKIKSRLRKRYYRTAQALDWDLSLLVANALTFNGYENPVYAQAVQLAKHIRSRLQGLDQSSRVTTRQQRVVRRQEEQRPRRARPR